jgi:TolB-like protein
MTEDLITALSKVGWLFVATRASSFACKGEALGTAAHHFAIARRRRA